MRRQRRTPIRVRFLALLALVGIVGGALYLTVPPLPDPDPIVGTEGARLWEFPIQSGVTPLAVDPAGDLYIYSEDHAIHAIDGRTGTERWRSGFPTSVTGAALGPDGSRLYVGSTDGAVLAFETSDGSIISEYGLGQEVFPAAGPGGELYAASFDGTLYRLSPQDDRLLWFTKVGASIEAAPVVGPDGTVYVPTNEPGSIVAVSPDAEKLWSADIGPVHVSPTLGSVYVAADDGVLYAFEEDGSLRWRHPIDGHPLAPPVVGSDGSVYFLTEDTVFSFSPDGDSQWAISWPDQDRPFFPTLVPGPDGNVYVLRTNGGLITIDAEGRFHNISYDTDAKWLAAGPESILYVGGSNGVAGVEPMLKEAVISVPATPAPIRFIATLSPRPVIRLFDGQQESLSINNAIAQFIIEHGYGYPTESVNTIFRE